MFDLERIKSEANVACLDYHPQLGSTNDRGKDLINQRLAGREGLEFPTLVVTDRQTAGRGQRHRKWWSGDGSLTFSWVRFEEVGGNRLASRTPISNGLAPLVVGIAVAEAIESLSDLNAIEIKWPNDLLVGGKKIAGILVETIASTCGSGLVVGVGVNVNNAHVSEQQIQSLNDRSQDRVGAIPLSPTSLQVATGKTICLTELLIEVVKRIEVGFEQLDRPACQVIAQANGRLAYRGSKVCVTTSNAEPISGICRGVSREGGLMIEVAGVIETIFSGNVALVSSSSPPPKP